MLSTNELLLLYLQDAKGNHVLTIMRIIEIREKINSLVIKL